MVGVEGCVEEFVEEREYKPFLDLVVPIIGLLHVSRLHHHLGRCPIHIFLKAYACQPQPISKVNSGYPTCPRHG
jgi:hypothetical protein